MVFNLLGTVDPGRRIHDFFLRRIFLAELPGDPTFMHDQDPVAHSHHFIHFRADDDDPRSICNQLIDQFVDFNLGPDINASGWLIENKDFRIGEQPLRDDHLLLIATAQPTHR